MHAAERRSNSSLHHLPSWRGREIVARGPVAGAVLAAEVEPVALERLQQHGGVAVILVADLVEIVLPDIHGEVSPQ